MANNEDKQLDDYLAGKSGLSDRYRSSNQAGPPKHLDEKILSAAQEAVKDKPERIVFHRSPWAKPVSIAAIITLSVSLVVTMQQETGQPLISEPKPVLFDSDDLMEEAVLPETKLLDKKVNAKQRLEGRKDEPAAVGLDAVDAYRKESSDVESKNEAVVKPAQRMLLKEKVRSRTQAPESQLFTEEALLQSAPMEMAADAIGGLKRDRQDTQQEQELLRIKQLWEEGEIESAGKAYRDFINNNPEYPVQQIEVMLGTDIYQALIEEN